MGGVSRRFCVGEGAGGGALDDDIQCRRPRNPGSPPNAVVGSPQSLVGCRFARPPARGRSSNAARRSWWKRSPQRVTSCTGRLPLCGGLSRRGHSHYRRSVKDPPIQGQRAVVVLEARKFLCDESGCSRRIFCERFPDSLVAYVGRTGRLDEIVTAMGLVGQRHRGVGPLAPPAQPHRRLRALRRAEPPRRARHAMRPAAHVPEAGGSSAPRSSMTNGSGVQGSAFVGTS